MDRLNGMMTVTLSGVRPGEAREVNALVRACGLHADDITEPMLRHFVVARKGGRIVGVVGLEVFGTDALLRSLAVEEKSRRQGVAGMLLKAVQRYARSQKITMLYLLTLTAADLFLNRGFELAVRDQAPQQIRNTREFACLCPETAVCLSKRIS
jgi:amino-acid N-acetyltransferase